MNNNNFNSDQQQEDISGKVLAGFERIYTAFKALLWEKAKSVGLSPIQIQILIFIANHDKELCNVSHLAKEFNVTKPTVSDAVKILYGKKMIEKEYSTTDSRSYMLRLTERGRNIVSETNDFADPMKSQINELNQPDLDNLLNTVSQLISKLNDRDILSVQRTCYGCEFFQKSEAGI